MPNQPHPSPSSPSADAAALRGEVPESAQPLAPPGPEAHWRRELDSAVGAESHVPHQRPVGSRPPSAGRARLHLAACAAAILLAAGLAWRVVRYGLAFPIWGDEAFVAVNLLTRDFSGMIQPLEYGQIVPLLFMWLELAVCRVLGPGELALRLPSFIAGILTLLLFWYWSARVLPRWPAVLALGFLAAAYYPVRHAAEVKPYATDLLVSLSLTVLTWRVLCRGRGRGPRCGFAPVNCPRSQTAPAGPAPSAVPAGCGRDFGLLLVLGMVAPWASYPSVFVAGACALILGWDWLRRDRSGRGLAGPAALAACVAASFLWMLLAYGHPHAQAAARLTEIGMWRQTFPPLSRPWELPAWLAAIHTGYMLAYPLGGSAPGSIVTLALVIVGALRLWKRQRLLLGLLLLPLPLTFVAAALEKYPYGGSARTSLYLAPAFCLLGGLGLYVALAGLVRLRRRWSWLRQLGRRIFRRELRLAELALAAAVMLALIPAAGAARDLLRPYKSESVVRSRNAVQTVAARTSTADVWVIFNSIERVDYAPYLGDWSGTGGQFVFDVLRFAPGKLAWAPRPQHVAPDPGGDVWLLAYRGVKAEFPQNQLDAYVAALAARFGTPSHERHLIKQRGTRIEALDVYHFAAPGARRPQG